MRDKLPEKKKPLFQSLNKKLMVTILICTGLFFACQMYMTSIVGTSNAAIEEIRKERDEIRLQNEIISSEIDKYKSIKNLQKLSEKYELQEKSVLEIPVTNDNELAVTF
jgi:hypothetical protein